MIEHSFYFMFGGSIILNVVLFFFCYGLFIALGELQKQKESSAEQWNRTNNDEELERTFVASAGKREKSL
nr:MAG TPA: protein of unknown function (DUF5542) [Caudoviricetes sp.]